MSATPPNLLYYGDNLDVLRLHVKDESVDLVYLDPPFNSNRAYNVIFAQNDTYVSDDAAQIEAFDDTWHWTPETDTHYKAVIGGGVPASVADALAAMRTLLGENDAMAYLVNMAPRLVELRRVLKPTGSIYLHCDPTMSHYLKVMMDATFGPTAFRSEIIWKRTSAHSSAKRYGPVHDTILFYAKSADAIWYGVTVPHDPQYVEDFFRQEEPDSGRKFHANVLTGAGVRHGESGKPWRGYNPTAHNRHWAVPGKMIDQLNLGPLSLHEKLDALNAAGRVYWPAKEDGSPRIKYYEDELDGMPAPDIWTDIRPISGKSAERLGYPTQKPEALLERIIQASSKEGDTVLDSFCGCGTTVSAAQRLKRRWVGIDITYLAIDLIEKRLLHTFPEIQGTYAVYGIPRDLPGAQALFKQNALDFERWAVSLVRGTPNEKQVGDKGIDGVIRFYTDAKGGTGRALVSVKGGKMVGPDFVRDLLGTVTTQKADMGVLITITEPTPGMTDAADHASTYIWPMNNQAFPKIQLFTVAELLAGKRPETPPTLTPYIKAQRFHAPPDQMTLDTPPSVDLDPADDDSAE